MFTNIRLTGTVLICLALFCLACPANTLSPPTADDIEQLSKESEHISTDFFRLCWTMCLVHEYKGPFTTAPASDKLRELAKKAADDQQQIIERQLQLKTVIEEYQADDWDERYGVTGLWRRLAGQIIESKLKKCLFDYYLALANNEPEKTELLRACLTMLDSIKTTDSLPLYILLKAKVLTALSQSDSTYKKIAQDFFDKIEKQKDLPSQIVNYLHLEKLRLSLPTNVEHSDSLAEDMISKNCSEDSGFVLSLCFLRRQFDTDAFKKTLVSCPDIRQNLETALLANYSAAASEGLLDKDLLARTAAFEADLLARATSSSQDSPVQHILLLDRLCESENTRTPLVLHMAAKACSENNPAKAVRLLIEATNRQLHGPIRSAYFSPESPARQAAQLAYHLFTQDVTYCQLAIEAFQNYAAISGRNIDRQIRYQHTVALAGCGQSDARIELLAQIAADGNDPYAGRAKVELIADIIRQKQNDIKEQEKLVIQLADLIESPNFCEFTAETTLLLSQVVEKIDTYLQSAQFPTLIQACKKLAQLSYDCSEGPNKKQAGLFLAEVSILIAGKENNNIILPQVEELFENISHDNQPSDLNLLRCRARLYTVRQKFDEAARIWEKIADARKSQIQLENADNWKWWRAKYYQLYCLSKTANADSAELSHTIDILLNSYNNIPAPWDKKLHKLIKSCKQNIHSL